MDKKMDKTICFATDSDGDLIRIEDGHILKTCVQFKTKELNQRKANKLNADLGVTKKDVAIMLHRALSDSFPKTFTVSGKE